MSIERQIKQFNKEEHLKSTALSKSIDMKYVDIISKSAPEYKERLSGLLKKIRIIMGNPMTKESQKRLDYLENQHDDIEELIKANIKAKIEIKDSSSLN